MAGDELSSSIWLAPGLQLPGICSGWPSASTPSRSRHYTPCCSGRGELGTEGNSFATVGTLTTRRTLHSSIHILLGALGSIVLLILSQVSVRKPRTITAVQYLGAVRRGRFAVVVCGKRVAGGDLDARAAERPVGGLHTVRAGSGVGLPSALDAWGLTFLLDIVGCWDVRMTEGE